MSNIDVDLHIKANKKGGLVHVSSKMVIEECEPEEMAVLLYKTLCKVYNDTQMQYVAGAMFKISVDPEIRESINEKVVPEIIQ